MHSRHPCHRAWNCAASSRSGRAHRSAAGSPARQPDVELQIGPRDESRHVPQGLLPVSRTQPGGNQPVDSTAKITSTLDVRRRKPAFRLHRRWKDAHAPGPLPPTGACHAYGCRTPTPVRANSPRPRKNVLRRRRTSPTTSARNGRLPQDLQAGQLPNTMLVYISHALAAETTRRFLRSRSTSAARSPKRDGSLIAHSPPEPSPSSYIDAPGERRHGQPGWSGCGVEHRGRWGGQAQGWRSAHC